MVPKSVLIGLVCVCLISLQGVAAHDTDGRHIQRTYVHTPLFYGASIGDGGNQIGSSSSHIALEEGEDHLDVTVTDASGLPVLVHWFAYTWDEEHFTFETGTVCGSGEIDLTTQMQALWLDLPNAADTAVDAFTGECGDPVTTATTGTIDVWIS